MKPTAIANGFPNFWLLAPALVVPLGVALALVSTTRVDNLDGGDVSIHLLSAVYLIGALAVAIEVLVALPVGLWWLYVDRTSRTLPNVVSAVVGLFYVGLFLNTSSCLPALLRVV
jgi:uncharacterized RDD family membrane protein YckC